MDDLEILREILPETEWVDELGDLGAVGWCPVCNDLLEFSVNLAVPIDEARCSACRYTAPCIVWGLDEAYFVSVLRCGLDKQ